MLSTRSRFVSLAAAALALGVAAAPASAVEATSGPAGLNIDGDASGDGVTVSLVDVAGVTKYRVDLPRPLVGQFKMSVGAGCVKESPDVALCDRVTPQVNATLGNSADIFKVDPSFPDPIRINGGVGKDTLRLGAGNDIAEGAQDEIFGEGGDDQLTGVAGGGIGNAVLHGGPGNDTLVGRNGFSTLLGEDGDDSLTIEQSDVAFTGGNLVGGPGTDTFKLNGVGDIDSRDGIAESVECGNERGANPFRGRDHAVIDLVDTLAGPLPGGGCRTVDRAPRNEKTSVALSSTQLRLSGRRVLVKVKCLTTSTCKGTASVKVGSSAAGTVRYSVAGKKTRSVAVTLPKAAARKVKGAGTVATVALKEKGDKGARTASGRLRIKR